MPKPIVIIHGWSDSSSSFRSLGKKLSAELSRPITEIHLADYESRDDAITFDDLVMAMDEAWTQESLPRTPGSVDAVVHSTGGLVIRDWLSRHFTATSQETNAPIRHLVMLAPANFGSPLAHKGHAFIGRVVKGWNSKKMFQTGANILKGLELASPYSWDLAMRDRFSKHTFYDTGKILCTVLVGNTGYSGIAAAANEEGSDGTVRVSTANLNCMYCRADFTEPHQPQIERHNSSGKVAFGVMDNENHDTIRRRFKNDRTLSLITGALSVTDASFSNWCRDLKSITDETMQNNEEDPYKYGFQNTVFLVRDQFDDHIQDYFLEFFADDEDAGWFEEMFHRDVIRSVHAHGDDAAFRSVLVDCTTLSKRIDQPFENMKMSLTAIPEFRENKNVGYRTFTDDDIGAIEIQRDDIPKFFQPNQTALVEIILKREQSPRVFKFRR